MKSKKKNDMRKNAFALEMGKKSRNYTMFTLFIYLISVHYFCCSLLFSSSSWWTSQQRPIHTITLYLPFMIQHTESVAFFSHRWNRERRKKVLCSLVNIHLHFMIPKKGFFSTLQIKGKTNFKYFSKNRSIPSFVWLKRQKTVQMY